jgi:hypothetical protein
MSGSPPSEYPADAGRFEPVHDTYDWYDGPRAGFADFGGSPHAFAARWSDELDDWEPAFRLLPIDRTLMDAVLEARPMHERWQAAFARGDVEAKSSPVLPEDAKRYAALWPAIAAAMDAAERSALRATAEFRNSREGQLSARGPGGVRRLEVRWTPVEAANRDAACG